MNLLSTLFSSALVVISLTACYEVEEPKNYASSLENIEKVASDFNRIQNTASNIETEVQALSSNYPIHEKNRQMKLAMKNCSVRQQVDGDSDSYTTVSGIIIGGNCPVSANLLQSFTMSSSGSMSGRYLAKMEIRDTNLATINNVYKSDISSFFKFENQIMTGSTFGNILSNQFGTVAVEGSISGDGTKVEQILSFTINSEVSEYVETISYTNRAPEFTYKLNGMMVTKNQYFLAKNKLGFIGKALSFNENLQQSEFE